MSRKSIMPNIAYDSQRRSFYVTMRSAPKKGEPAKRIVRCFPTLEQAIQVLDGYNAGRILSQSTGTEELTVGQCLTYWLEQVIKPCRTASTVHGYNMIIRNHLAPSLGQIRLKELTAAQIQQYLNRKQAEGLCSNTVRKHHGVIHNALEHARRQDLLSRNPAQWVFPPSSTHPTHHFYDDLDLVILYNLLKIMDNLLLNRILRKISQIQYVFDIQFITDSLVDPGAVGIHNLYNSGPHRTISHNRYIYHCCPSSAP